MCSIGLEGMNAPAYAIVNRNRKLLISRAPTKAKLQEPAYSQALNQNKIDRQRSRSRESDRHTVRRLWCLELRRGGRYGVAVTPHHDRTASVFIQFYK